MHSKKFGFVLLLPLLLAACSRSGKPPAPVTARPGWLRQGIVMVGNWEPVTFLVRRGGYDVDAIERWHADRTEESVRKMKALGVNLAIINLHKGAGLKAEAEDIAAARKFTEIAHRYGIRVGGYVGCTMLHETFFAEEPTAGDWKQVDEWGRPIYYDPGQTYRYLACYSNPGHQAFLRKVLRLGVQDLKMDLIHFDGIQLGREPGSCRCKYCRERFREFLKARYPGPQARMRFGFDRLDGIEPPPYNTPSGGVALGPLTNPSMQEWAQFRCANLKRIFGDYDRYIRDLNPEVAVEMNPNLNYGMNMGFSRGIDVAQLLEHGDIVWSEERNDASYKEDGRLVSKMRSFKAVRSMGKSLFVYTGEGGVEHSDSPPELRMAEAMAYNDSNLGMVAGLDVSRVSPAARRYIDFFRGHVNDFLGTTSLADVAVLRSFASVEFNPSRSLVSTVVFEQSLLQSGIPFDLIFDRHLKDLGKYKVVVLANQDALSDSHAAALRDFVNNGGGLVATESTGMLTDCRLRRHKCALADLFGVDQPNTVVRREVGRGRVVYLPRIELATTPPRGLMTYVLGNEHWKLPENYRELVAAVKWAALDRLSVEVDAPPSVAAELTRKDANRWLLHLINFDVRRSVANVAVRLRVPAGMRVAAISIETPDGAAGGETQAVVRGDVATFLVPHLKIYNLVTVKIGS